MVTAKETHAQGLLLGFSPLITKVINVYYMGLPWWYSG